MLSYKQYTEAKKVKYNLVNHDMWIKIDKGDIKELDELFKDNDVIMYWNRTIDGKIYRVFRDNFTKYKAFLDRYDMKRLTLNVDEMEIN